MDPLGSVHLLTYDTHTAAIAQLQRLQALLSAAHRDASINIISLKYDPTNQIR